MMKIGRKADASTVGNGHIAGTSAVGGIGTQWSEAEHVGSPPDFPSILRPVRGIGALLALAVCGVVIACIVNVLPVVNSAKVVMGFGMLSGAFSVLVIGVLALVLIVVLRQDQVAAVVVIAVHLYVDWYLGLALIAHLLALALLVIFFLGRSARFPWVEPRGLWLWLLFLVITIGPAMRGALTPHDTLNYYPNIVLGAFIMYWLGTAIARDNASLTRLFAVLSLFATLIAIHTIVQATLGITLLGSSQVDAYLTTVSNYQLVTGTAIYRLGSFFVDPNWNGTFLATMLFLPLGLCVKSSSLLAKLFYLAQALIILPALLFTYSTGAWVAAGAGILAFVILSGRAHYRVQFSLLVGIAVLALVLYFPDQLALLTQHATGPNEISLRAGAWQTALRVIEAFPLTGVGLGQLAYMVRAEPYRVPAQIIPLDHPHNAYLEFGAMGGLPVLCVFLALLCFALWQALRNWKRVEPGARALLAGGIASMITLSVNSWSINGWTLPPLAAIGWLILGALSSPLLVKAD